MCLSMSGQILSWHKKNGHKYITLAMSLPECEEGAYLGYRRKVSVMEHTTNKHTEKMTCQSEREGSSSTRPINAPLPLPPLSSP